MEAQHNAKRPDINTYDILKMYQDGLSATQIATTLGIAKSSVARRLKKSGLILRKTGDYRGAKRYWAWKGDDYYRDPLMRSRNAAAHRTWSLAVRSRDNNTCQSCSATNVKLHAHHIISLKECVETTLAYDVENGVTLCISCHMTRHAVERKER